MWSDRELAVVNTDAHNPPYIYGFIYYLIKVKHCQILESNFFSVKMILCEST